jgi:CheY-like chemotaxis protein/Flp pilus assembly protein TadD
MNSNLADKKGKVVIVDSSGAARQMITDVIKTIGFQDMTGLSNVKDALRMLEVESIDWMLIPLDKGQEVNALQTLKIITQQPNLKRTRISLLVEEAERSCLGYAYAHGLLSHHDKPFTKETLTNSLNLLFQRLESYKYDDCLTSAEYLRDYLKSSKSNEQWLDFEKSLIELYPGQTRLLVKIAEPQFLNNLKDQGKTSLRQAKLMDENLAPDIKGLLETYCPGEELSPSDAQASINILGVQKCVVIDNDNAVQNSIKQVLGEVGLTDVQCFDDGESALEHLKKNPDPGLIIQEWRIPKLTGPLFLQMMRKEGTVSSPIIVLSSLLQQDDFPLVKEMGVANIVQKPFEKNAFLKSIVFTIQQDRTPTEAHAIERKIRQLIAAKKFGKAAEFKMQYLSDKSVSEGKKKLIEAEYAYASGDFPAAKVAGFDALKLGAESILILNLLGKVLMKLGDFPSALRCFERAQTLSPLNIERLCKIAEVHTEMGNDQKAAEAITDAKKIEEQHRDIKVTETKMALQKGDTDTAKKLMSQLDSLDELISYMNNKAVALARSGDVEGGISQYRKTLQSIPDDRVAVKAVVHYNSGLAYARSGDLEEAKAALEKAIKVKSDVKRKAESLRRRVVKSIETGEPLQLRSDDPSQSKQVSMQLPEQEELGKKSVEGETDDADKTSESADENIDVVAAVETAKRDLCCFMVFHDSREFPADVTEMTKTLPRFGARSAISRSAAFGADKMLKQAG